MTDNYEAFPSSGIKQGELASLHLALIDNFLTSLVGEDHLAEINAALEIPDGYDGTTADGDLGASGFIRVADVKLRLLQRCVHVAMVNSIKSKAPRKKVSRGAYGDGPTPAELDNARKWLQIYDFNLPTVRAKHPHADPEAIHRGVVGRPPVRGSDGSFAGLDLVDLEDYRDLTR